MTFFGTMTSLEKWQDIIAVELGKVCTAILIVNNHAQFSVDLTTDDRQYLQDNVWYRAENDAPHDSLKRTMPWNMRVSFRE